MAFAPPMPGASTDLLSGPPPSPTPMSPPADTGSFSMAGIAGPAPIPTNQMPPEVLTGLTAAASQIGSLLDSFAQVTPDKQAQLAMIKDLLQQYLADVMASGGGAVSPTASGPAFPGGGVDRGIAGAGAV